MHTPQPIILNPADPDNQLVVTAQELLECLEEKKGELKDGPYDIVKQVVNARDIMEQFETGGIGKSFCPILKNSNSRKYDRW